MQRLLHDTTANVLAMGAAAIIPIAAMVGSGLDLSRAYLVQARMQQACDAAALAARKKLSSSETVAGQVPLAVRNVADDFFAANFQDGDYGSENLEFDLSAGTATRMDGVATADLPMAIMQVVGFDKMEIAVECSAELNLPNIDVMLVLDLSSSMTTNDRIGSLKNAVLEFYDEVQAVKPPNARIRIGVVPYSSTVNVGRLLYDANPDWIASSWNYQTREAMPPEQYSNAEQLLPTNLSNLASGSTRWGTNSETERTRCENTDNTPGNSREVGLETWVITNAVYLPNHHSGGAANARGACRANVAKTRYPYRHLEKSLDTSQFKTFASVSTNTGLRGAAVSSTWNGCIEERATVPNATWATIPSGALDLDINTVPNPANPATQWKPQWAQVTFVRQARETQSPDVFITTENRSSHSTSCPSAARKLREYPLVGGNRNPDFQTYINGLTPNGGTMHDIGMVWGARLLVANGLFASENANAPNGDPIRRYIIFMTDGEMGADPRNYIGYGNPNMDGRFRGFKGVGQRWSEAELADVHNLRLAALCERVKGQNITVFTITFDLSQNQFTRGCASGNERAYEANGADELVETFREIAGTVAELRLVN